MRCTIGTFGQSLNVGELVDTEFVLREDIPGSVCRTPVFSYSVVANTDSVALNSGSLIFLYARLNNFSTVSKP